MGLDRRAWRRLWPVVPVMSLSHRNGTWTGQKGVYLRLGDTAMTDVETLRGDLPATTYVTRLVLAELLKLKRKRKAT